MLKLPQLQALRAGMQSDVNEMQAALGRLNSEIERLKSDPSRNADWLRSKIEEARAAAMVPLGEKLGIFGARLEATRAQERFWQSKELVLSLQAFDADPAKDAAIRLAKIAEFAATPARVLQLIADSAKEDNNFPLLYTAYIAGHDRTGQPGWRGIDLADVALPEQDAALQIIREVEALTMRAQDIVALASGSGLSPVRKLQTARASRG